MKFYDIDRHKNIKIESTLYEIEILRNILRFLDYGVIGCFMPEEKKFIAKNLVKIQKKIDLFQKQTEKNNKKKFEAIKI